MCLFSIYISPCEYLIHLLVAHTTSKTLLNSVHVIVCWVLWPSKIKLLDVFNALIKVRKFVIVEFLFEKFGFEDHLKSWTFMLYIKTVFKMILQKKFPKFFKISISLKFNRSRLFFGWSNYEGEKWLFFLKVSVSLDSFRSIEPVFMCISILAQFLSTDQISNFTNI